MTAAVNHLLRRCWGLGIVKHQTVKNMKGKGIVLLLIGFILLLAGAWVPKLLPAGSEVGNWVSLLRVPGFIFFFLGVIRMGRERKSGTDAWTRRCGEQRRLWVSRSLA